MKNKSRLHLALLFLLATQILHAQLIAPTRCSNDTEIFDSPQRTIPADMDNDGDMDLVSSSRSYESNIVWFENLDGNGSMDDPKVILNITGAIDKFISVEDVDGDGALDIIGMVLNQLFWVRNTLAENDGFSDLIPLPLSGLTFHDQAQFTDVNGDGIRDIIVVGNFSGQTIKWLEGIDGNGNFLPAEVLTNEGNDFIELVDLDNDGDIDIVSFMSNTLGWMENLDGNANFGSFQIIDPIIGSPQDLQMADFDSDGDLDILVGVSSGISNAYYYYWHENDLDNTGIWNETIISNSIGLAVPTLLDLDTDGDLDMITSRGVLWVFENTDGQGTFMPADTLGPFGGTSFSHADLNSDGVQDVISVISSSISQREMGLIFFGRADQTFENPIDYIGDADAVSYNSGGFLEARDLNGDGITELISSHLLLDRFAWQSFNNSNLKFTNPHIIDDIQVSDIDYADFDGDGDEDITVVANKTGSNQVIWYEKINGEFNYGPPNVLFEEHQSSKQIHAADLDNDGDMDIVLNKPGGDENGIHWFENLDGQGNFSNFQTIASNFFDLIQLEDMDQDGDLDVFGYDESSDGFYWFENNNTVFSDQALILGVENVASFLFEDVDENGWKDIVYIKDDNIVSLHKNNGALGDFSAPINFVGIIGPLDEHQIFLRDNDEDGDQDLLVWNLNDDNSFLYFYEHLGGPNTFSNGSPVIALPDNTGRISVDDYDGDQDMDLIIHSDDRSIYFIENFLNLSKITGKSFLDENQNGIFDLGEFLIFPEEVLVNPDAVATFPSGPGYFNFAVDNGTHNVACIVHPGFGFTTPPVVQVEVEDDLNPDPICFGVFPNINIIKPIISISSAPTRCGFEVPFWLDYQNFGTVPGDAVIAFDIDSAAVYLSADPMPDSIVGQTIYWSHENLLPSHSGQIEVLLQMPGVDFLGSFLDYDADIFIESIGGTSLSESGAFLYTSQINCAYDPNDKTVEPSIPGNENFTLFGDTLNYLVRFQNTGTDTAFTVIIEDYLDSDLDYTSLEVMGASHFYDVTLDQTTGRLVFVFDNILLPDSTTNEVKSHGFFRYRIQHKENLPEYTYIQNFASIYFDFNPPIVTNTVESILVSTYPLLVNAQNSNCSDANNGSLTILFDLPFYESILWSTGDSTLSITNLSAGSYDLSVIYSDGSQTDTTFIITAPPAIEILDPIVQQLSCFDIAEASIEITVEGGTPDYTYAWSNAVFTANQYDLPAGTYTLTLTDANACTSSLEVIIDEAPAAIDVSADVSPISCFGFTDGSIETSTTGGTLGYTFEWSNSATEENITDLGPGTYTLTITDNNNCTTTFEEMLTAPDEIILSINVTPEQGQNMNGTISVQASGGQVPFSYAWDFDPTATSNLLSGLGFGDYTVTVSDANDCSQVETITVDQLSSSPTINALYNFKVSPNPTDGIFNTSFSFPVQKVWQLDISNSIGQLVRTQKSSPQGSTGDELSFDLDVGIYHVTLQVDGQITAREIVIVQ